MAKINKSVIKTLPKGTFLCILKSLFKPESLSSLLYSLVFIRKSVAVGIRPNLNYKDNKKFEESKKWFSKIKTKGIYLFLKKENIKLYADYIENINYTNKTVIIAHGYGMNPLDMNVWIKLFYDLGFNILLPHSRSHGLSEGKFHTMGIQEQEYYIKWAEKLIEENKGIRILYFGVSMGGATVLMLSSSKLPKNVAGIISDCPYSSLKEQLSSDNIFNMIRCVAPHINKEKFTRIIDELEKKVNKELNISLNDMAAKEQVKIANTPIMMIHEKNDNFVPSYMSSLIFNNINPNLVKELHIIDNKNNYSHGTSIAYDYDYYKNLIINFIKKINL